jgi:CRP/FNR family putative post-exponential-phase nitrogen-starvation transcriptional regulator
VAPYLGVTYRHLLYVLAELGKEGILEKTNQGYRIIDQKGLEALCIR